MNAVNWFEIPSVDYERAVRFYETVYAAELKRDDSFEGMRMAIFPHAETGVGGCVCYDARQKPNADGVRIYLNAGDDLAPLLGRVAQAGGEVVMPKTFLADEIGHIAMFRDSEGNLIGLHSLH